MAFDLTKLVDLVRGKKSINVKSHERSKPTGGETSVNAYLKLVALEKAKNKNKDIESGITDETIEKDLTLDTYEDAEKDDVVESDEDKDDEEVSENLDSPGVDINLDEANDDSDLSDTISKIEIETLKDIKEEDIKPLIVAWQTKGDEEAIKKVLDFYMPIIVFHANKHKTGPIPYNLVILRAKQLAINAATQYKPDKGTRFNTFLTWYLKKLYRFVNDNKNIAKIPEQRVRKVTAYQNAHASLSIRLDREPTDIEIADELNWPVKEISRLRNELSRREILSYGETTSYADLGIHSPKLNNALKLVHLDSSNEERFILEHITEGFNKKQLSLKDIAKKLKISESKVKYLISNLKMKILENV